MNDRHAAHRNPKPFRRTRWLAAALLVATSAIAAPGLRTVEECLETGTLAVRLPGTATGTLSATPCVGCPGLQLRFDSRTVYLLGKERVTYAKFREAAAKGDFRLDLYYQPQSRVLTRLRLAAARDGQ